MDADAYCSAVREIKDRVYTYAAYLLGDQEQAKDVAQEALVRLWEHRSSVPEVNSARAWTLRTVHNLAIDLLRSRRTRRDVGPEALDVRESPGRGQQEVIEVSEGRAAVRMGLLRLTAEDRGILLMREFQMLSYDEIARILDIPLGTVKVRLHRARQRLREVLEEAGVKP